MLGQLSVDGIENDTTDPKSLEIIPEHLGETTALDLA